jgi:hypothetical protein
LDAKQSERDERDMLRNRAQVQYHFECHRDREKLSLGGPAPAAPEPKTLHPPRPGG